MNDNTFSFQPKYEITHYHRKADNYSRFARIVCGLEFDESTKLYISEIFHLARGIDNGIDALNVDDLIHQKDYIVGSIAGLITNGKYQYLPTKDSDFISSQIDNLNDIIACNINYRSTDDFEEYRSWRLQECTVFEDIILSGFSSVVRNQENYSFFEKIFKKTSRCSQIINSAVDLKRECRSNFLALEYHPLFLVKLMSNAAVQLIIN